MTNADYIRQMTDDELAEIIATFKCRRGAASKWCDEFDGECEACYCDWLKQPYKEGNLK